MIQRRDVPQHHIPGCRTDQYVCAHKQAANERNVRYPAATPCVDVHHGKADQDDAEQEPIDSEVEAPGVDDEGRHEKHDAEQDTGYPLGDPRQHFIRTGCQEVLVLVPAEEGAEAEDRHVQLEGQQQGNDRDHRPKEQEDLQVIPVYRIHQPIEAEEGCEEAGDLEDFPGHSVVGPVQDVSRVLVRPLLRAVRSGVVARCERDDIVISHCSLHESGVDVRTA